MPGSLIFASSESRNVDFSETFTFVLAFCLCTFMLVLALSKAKKAGALKSFLGLIGSVASLVVVVAVLVGLAIASFLGFVLPFWEEMSALCIVGLALGCAWALGFGPDGVVTSVTSLRDEVTRQSESIQTLRTQLDQQRQELKQVYSELEKLRP